MSSPRRTEPEKAQVRDLGRELDELYARFNKRVYVNPDPLVFLYGYEEPGDRELVALIASALAYGRVAQILKSVKKILDVLGPSPREFLMTTPASEIAEALEGFKHRFSSGREICVLLQGAKRAIERHGSLEACFLSGYSPEHENIVPALERFSKELCSGFENGESYLLSSPSKGSACKRSNMMLRWLLRSDEVDPGGWRRIPTSKLLVPLDTHMFRIARGLGLTRRKSADLKAAIEISRGFARFSPEDPAKYDFALTRSGINPEIRKAGLIKLPV
jgi:uncharacterized protein (TIGR02757 family)